MNPSKHRLLLIGLVLLLIAAAPSLWVPFPCIKAPCTAGRGVQSEPDPRKTPASPAIGMDAAHIQAIIQAALHGDLERTP